MMSDDVRARLAQAETALLDSIHLFPSLILEDDEISHYQIERLLKKVECAAVEIRTAAEETLPAYEETGKKAPYIPYTGRAEITEFGWIHLKLDGLLPSCRYQTSPLLVDTLNRLLNSLQEGGRKLPYFNKALLVIEEHCSLQNRTVYDQDNKGWKAIPNALKGAVVADDDQFSLEICLLSKQSEECCCHIYVMPREDASDFFALRSGNYGPFL